MTKRSLHADTHGRQSPVWSATPGTGEVVRRLELTKGALRCGTSSRGSLQGSPRQASKLTQARGQPNKAWRVKPPLRRAKSGKRKSTRSGAVGGPSLVPRPPSPLPSPRGPYDLGRQRAGKSKRPWSNRFAQELTARPPTWKEDICSAERLMFSRHRSGPDEANTYDGLRDLAIYRGFCPYGVVSSRGLWPGCG
jgi:hypothetical protein